MWIWGNNVTWNIIPSLLGFKSLPWSLSLPLITKFHWLSARINWSGGLCKGFCRNKTAIVITSYCTISNIFTRFITGNLNHNVLLFNHIIIFELPLNQPLDSHYLSWPTWTTIVKKVILTVFNCVNFTCPVFFKELTSSIAFVRTTVDTTAAGQNVKRDFCGWMDA